VPCDKYKRPPFLHAYLHRAEGNIGNAKYWYRRAGADIPNNHLEAELNQFYAMTNKQKYKKVLSDPTYFSNV